MDTPQAEEHASSMTPLGTVLAARMERLGWSAREVERRGGPSASTINRLVSSDPKQNRNPPGDDNLERLARVLTVPLPRLLRAAEQTRGRQVPAPLPEHVETVAAALSGLDDNSQAVLAEVVVMVADRIRAVAEQRTPDDAPIDTATQVALRRAADRAAKQNAKDRERSGENVGDLG